MIGTYSIKHSRGKSVVEIRFGCDVCLMGNLRPNDMTIIL